MASDPTSGGSTATEGTGGVTEGLWLTGLVNPSFAGPAGAAGTGTVYQNLDGMDLVWGQTYLQTNMEYIEGAMVNIEKNSNLSDEEKMYALQMSSESYDEEGLTRTALLKGIDDLNKSIARNCG